MVIAKRDNPRGAEDSRTRGGFLVARDGQMAGRVYRRPRASHA